MTIPPALPSASVIIMRDIAGLLEVLLVKRNSKIVFHGGAWVFPGGKVDPEDHALEPDGCEIDVARRAAVREVNEEAGLVMDPADLCEFSHWTTPENQPKRFAAWFFVGIVASNSEVVVDGSEIVDHRWVGVDEALVQRQSGEIILPPPAYVSLLKIRAFTDGNAVLRHVAQNGPQLFAPKVLELDNGRCSLYTEDAGYDSNELTEDGPQHRLHMLKSGWEYIENY